MEGVKLLDFLVSPFAIRVRIALAEKGVEYENMVQDLEEKSELLVGSNPIYEQVPVLIHDGKPVCESLIIVQYIDETWPDKGPTFLPKDPYQRAHARFWADFIDKKIYVCGQKIVKTKGEDKEKAKEEMISNMKLLETTLGNEPFFGGEAFGYLDISLISFGSWFHAFEFEGGFSIMDVCPKILEWVNRCKKRKSVSEALPDPKATIEYAGVLKQRIRIE